MKFAATALLLLAGCAQAQSPDRLYADYKDLKYPPLRAVKIPDVPSFTLSNGMKVYLLEDHELPLVRGFAIVRTGNLFDPADKVGLATMTGSVMRSGGTASKTGDQLDEQLENIASSVESQIGETFGEVSFSTLKEHTNEVLDTFHDVIVDPAYRQDKIDLTKNQLRSGISRRNDDAQGIAQREFASRVYGSKTPYGWAMEYSTIDAIGRQDLIDFYKRYFFPANIMLAIEGDFSTPEMRARLEKLFGNWSYTQPPVPAFPAVERNNKPGTYLAVKTNVTQTSFILGQLGGELRDKDLPALEVMADILGGGFRSRLFQKVRTQLGFAYEVYADWGAGYDHPGLFLIGGSTKSASTTEALKVIEQELERIRTTEVSAAELEAARQAVINSFVFNFDTPSKTLHRLITYEYYGYPKDFLFQYQKALSNVTRADILRAARERVDPKKLILIAVGNPQDYKEPLASLGQPVAPIDLTIPEPKKQAVAPASVAGLEKGTELLRRMQQAAGGAEKLAAIADVQQNSQIKISQGPGGSMNATQLVEWMRPASYRQENVLPFGRLAAFTDGKSGWLASPGRAGPLQGAELKQIQGELFRFWVPLLLSDRDASRSVVSTAENTVDISDQAGDSVRVVVDAQTGLPAKEIYQTVQPGGPPVTAEETFSDYRDVQEMKVPWTVHLTQNGQPFAEISVQDFKMNTGLTAAEIGKKPEAK